jgi:hypothetical protein
VRQSDYIFDSSAGNAGALARRGPKERLTFPVILLQRGFSRLAANAFLGAGEGARAPSTRLPSLMSSAALCYCYSDIRKSILELKLCFSYVSFETFRSSPQ